MIVTTTESIPGSRVVQTVVAYGTAQLIEPAASPPAPE